MSLKKVEDFETALDKMQSVLDRLILATNTLSQSGADVSIVKLKISEAEAQIVISKETIASQKENDYTLTITDETSIKNDIGETRNLLKAHLKNVRDQLKITHASILEVKSALSEVQKAI